MSDDYNLGLRVGAACNQAAEVLSGSWRLLSDATLTEDQLIELHLQLAEGFMKNAATIQAATTIAQAFPGTTQVPAQDPGPFPAQQQAAPQGFPPANNVAPTNVAQGPWPQQQAPAPQQQQQYASQGQNFQPAPGVQSGGSKTDQEWMALFNNPSGFYDNRQSKKTPNSPDFRQKNGDIALWLNGKFGPAPQWVFDRLQGGYGPVQ